MSAVHGTAHPTGSAHSQGGLADMVPVWEGEAKISLKKETKAEAASLVLRRRGLHGNEDESGGHKLCGSGAPHRFRNHRCKIKMSANLPF